MAILPIVTLEHPALRTRAKSVTPETPGLQTFIDDLIDTMINASGIGLAAPQTGRSLRIFVVDTQAITEEEENSVIHGDGIFINPEITPVGTHKWDAEEGCLSIPHIREKVTRYDRIQIRYFDRHFNEHTEIYDEWTARVLQHEYDHLNGVLFIDYLGSFRKKMIQSKLNEIISGEIETDYPIVPKKKDDIPT